MSKYYFEELDSESCHTKDYFQQLMIDNDVFEMKVYEAEVMRGEDFFYCNHYKSVGEKIDSGCGKDCDFYKPRNGKSGNCKHNRNLYEPNKVITLKRVFNTVNKPK